MKSQLVHIPELHNNNYGFKSKKIYIKQHKAHQMVNANMCKSFYIIQEMIILKIQYF